MENDKQISKRISSLNESESKELLKSLISKALSEDQKEQLTIAEKLQRLEECKNAIKTKHDFKVGDYVEWKPNLKNRAFPEYEEPLIVLEILENPLLDNEEGPGSTYFNEPLDVVLGLIAEDGEFITFYFDSRRIQPFQTK